MDTEALARQLRTLLVAANRTQQEVADRVGVTRQAISHMMTGRTLPPLDTLARVAEACGFRMQLTFVPVEAQAVTVHVTPSAASVAREVESLSDVDKAMVARWVRMLPHLPEMRRKLLAVEVELWEAELDADRGE